MEDITLQIEAVLRITKIIPLHTHNGSDSLLISPANLSTAGAMLVAIYDPASIQQQVVGISASQTISNKTLTKPVVNASVQGISTLSGTTPTLDCSLANFFPITLSGSTTFSISNVTTNQFFMVEAAQGSGTTYTTTFWSGITWNTVGGAAPTQTLVSGGLTTYGFRCTGAGAYIGYLVATN